MKTFKDYVSEGIWGSVGQQANIIKKKVVRATVPNKIRVAQAYLGATGKAMSYDKDNLPQHAANIRKWRDEIASGKRKLRG